MDVLEKQMVEPVGCATYDVMHDITTIHRNGDWWDKEYEGEEKITDKITDHEALEILEEVMEMDDSMYQYNQRYLEALNMALDALKFKKKAGVVIEQLRADRDRLATALDEIERTITEHAYPVRYDTNSIELGMTLTGIKQAFDMHRKGEE